MTSVFTLNQKSFSNQSAQPVALVSNRTDESIETGARWPCLVQIEYPSSVQLLFDSKDRINPSDDPWNFTVDLTTNLTRARSVQCVRAIVPKIPNVTVFNNTLIIKHQGGTTSAFTLPVAFYNTTSLANALTSAINAAFVAAAIVDTVVTSFDAVTNTFSITSTGGLDFFIVDNCSFITRGTFLAPFESEPLANAPSKSTIYSGPVGMVYSRYITVHSPTLNQYSYSDSLTSSFTQQSDIVCILDISSIEDPVDFDATVPYGGAYKTITTSDAPIISVTNGQKNFHNVQSFFCLDEWGSPVQDIMNLGGNYPANKLGITLYFVARF